MAPLAADLHGDGYGRNFSYRERRHERRLTWRIILHPPLGVSTTDADKRTCCAQVRPVAPDALPHEHLPP